MTIVVATLNEGWENYQRQLIQAIAPLSEEQLALGAAPHLNPIWVLLLIGEKPTRLSLLGGAIVLGAVTWRAVASIRRAARPR